jgi:ABC-type transporter MlaC component
MRRVFVPLVIIPLAVILTIGTLKAMLPAPILSASADSSAKSDPAGSYIAGFFRATVETAIASHSEEYATKAVKVLLLRAIQLDETARFMLGRFWPSDNKEAGRRFQQQFRDFAAEAVTQGLRANPDLVLEVTGSRARPDGSTLVSSTLVLPSGTEVPVDWRVEPNPKTGSFRIGDMTVAGIDAAIMLRTMAEATLAETDLDGLIPNWRAALVRRTGGTAKHPTVTSP